MSLLINLSLKKKLLSIAMLSSSIALLLASLAFMLFDIVSFKNHMVNNFSTLAEIIGDNITAALIFDNRTDAQETLASLKAEKNILSAYIYTAYGEVFATYYQHNVTKNLLPPYPQKDGHQFENNTLILTRSIILHNNKIGAIYLQSDLKEMYSRIKKYAGIIFIFMAVSSLIAFLIMSKLQRIVSLPILHLTEVTRKVSENKDYSIRATKYARDETGFLVEKFNEMLEIIETRDTDLQEAHTKVKKQAEALEEEISIRMQTEEALREMNEELEKRVEERTADLATANRELQAEIGEHKMSKETIQRRDAVLEAVSLAAREFLISFVWEKNIGNILRRLGQATNASRVYIFKNHSEERDDISLTSQIYEWTAPDSIPQIDNPDLKNFSWKESGFSRWEDTLSRGEIIYGNVKDFPINEQVVLTSQYIKSIAVVPIFVLQKWWGFIGFDECKEERAWGAAEMDALKAAADILGSAIQQQWAEERLRESEEKYRMIAETATDGIYQIDTKGRIIFLNTACAQIWGYTSIELFGKHFYTLITEKWLPKAQEIFEDLLAGEKRNGELALQHKDGHAFPIYFSAMPIKKQNQIVGVTFLVSDISKQKQIEEQLRQTQKMEAIGVLAGGIAHDFNTLLATILGYGSMMKDLIPEDSRIRNYLEKMMKSGYRSKELIKQLMDFARPGNEERIPLPIVSILEESINLLQASLPATIKIHLNIETQSGTVLANPSQIKQVIMNLGINAGHAINERGGDIILSLKDVLVDAQLAKLMEVIPGLYVKLMVSDTGKGIDLETQQRMFDPFFTTKGIGQGTGLGLSVVHGIVKAHQGFIRVESEIGKGSTFHVYLPMIQAHNHENNA